MPRISISFAVLLTSFNVMEPLPTDQLSASNPTKTGNDPRSLRPLSQNGAQAGGCRAAAAAARCRRRVWGMEITHLQYWGNGRVDDLPQFLFHSWRTLDVARRSYPPRCCGSLRRRHRFLSPLLQHGADLVHFSQVSLRPNENEWCLRRMRADLWKPGVFHVLERFRPDDREADDKDVGSWILAKSYRRALILEQKHIKKI